MSKKLTAEQVREAVESNSWAETSSIREFNDSSWQAIADELNATLEDGTCDWELVKSGPLYLVFRCSACGYEHSESMTDAHATDFDPAFCPKCGTLIRKAVGE